MQFFQQKDLEKLEKDLIDKNTQLYNKTALYFLMNHILLQHERYEENYSFIIFDCSKEHSVRSNCKDMSQSVIDKAIAEKLKKICRRSDILFHCSEGIFCILTRVFLGDDTVLFCEKITRNFEYLGNEDCTLEVKPKYGITFSKMDDTPESFAQRSWDALNRAIDEEEIIVIET